MRNLLLPLGAVTLLTAFGCAPQDAEVTGNWSTWLAVNSSATVAEGELESLEDAATIFECSGRGWDEIEGTWDPGYAGPRESSEYKDPRFIGGDCPRDYNDESEEWDGEYLAPCTEDADDDGVPDLLAEMQAECQRIADEAVYGWILDDGYYGVSSSIEPWRSEAIINGEGDFQLTVHHDLGHGQDFRFMFSVAPDFAPTSCETDDSGEPYITYVDGQNWLQQWSQDEDGHNIFYLNAGASQLEPSELLDDDETAADADYWYLPTDWNSGYGHSKWAAETFSSLPNSFAEGVSTRIGLNDPEVLAEQMAIYEQAIEAEHALNEHVAFEWGEVWGGNTEDYSFETRVEDNLWRDVDNRWSGLDGWVETHTSWVRIKSDSDLSEGGFAEGDFQIVYSGLESGSFMVVQGEFKVDRIRKDRWAYPILEDDLREQNETPYCGGATSP